MTEFTKNPATNQKIKGAKTTVLLGFLSFVGCGLYALPGTILAILGIVMYRKCKTIYMQNPQAYEKSFVDARVGLIISVIGLLVSIITLIWTLGLFWPIWFGQELY